MPYQRSNQAYCSRLGRTKVGLATHGKVYRSFFGFGRKRCFHDGEPWRAHGCSQRHLLFWEYLQRSSPRDRADDLRLRPELFTEAEAERIARLDRPASGRSAATGSAPVPEAFAPAERVRGVAPYRRDRGAPYPAPVRSSMARA